jgi:hypothetical protein
MRETYHLRLELDLDPVGNLKGADLLHEALCRLLLEGDYDHPDHEVRKLVSSLRNGMIDVVIDGWNVNDPINPE